MTDQQPPPAKEVEAIDVERLRAVYDDLARGIRARVDSLDAFHLAQGLLTLASEVEARARELRDQQVVRVKVDRELSLAKLAEVLSMPIGRTRMHQLVQRALPPDAEPPAA